jgi:hypothetical protein
MVLLTNKIEERYNIIKNGIFFESDSREEAYKIQLFFEESVVKRYGKDGQVIIRTVVDNFAQPSRKYEVNMSKIIRENAVNEWTDFINSLGQVIGKMDPLVKSEAQSKPVYKTVSETNTAAPDHSVVTIDPDRAYRSQIFLEQFIEGYRISSVKKSRIFVETEIAMDPGASASMWVYTVSVKCKFPNTKDEELHEFFEAARTSCHQLQRKVDSQA